MDEETERACQLVVIVEIVDPVVVVERGAQLGTKLLPVGVSNTERRGADIRQPTDEPPPIGWKVRREEDDVQRSANLSETGCAIGLRPKARDKVSAWNMGPKSPFVAKR